MHRYSLDFFPLFFAGWEEKVFKSRGTWEQVFFCFVFG